MTMFNGSQTYTAIQTVNVSGGTTPTPNPTPNPNPNPTPNPTPNPNPNPNPVPSGSCGLMTANNVFIGFHNAANTCSEFVNGCSRSELLEFTAKTFTGYSFSCANHTFHWDFGDGATSDSMNTSHAFADTKTYNVTLTINNGSQTFIAQQGVVIGNSTGPVIPGRIIPEVAFSMTSLENIPKLYTFTPAVSPASTILKWSWDFGDGQKTTATTGADQVHRYTDFGTFIVTLTVEDNLGPVKTYTREVIVQPPHRRATR